MKYLNQGGPNNKSGNKFMFLINGHIEAYCGRKTGGFWITYFKLE